MKKWLVVFLSIGCFLSAEETPPTTSKQSPNDPTQSFRYWDLHPLHVGGNALAISSAKISDAGQSGDLIYRKMNTFLYMIVPINTKSYFLPQVEWNTFTMDWSKNRKFNQTQFNFVGFNLTFYTTQIDQWRWIIRGEYNLDTRHFTQPRLYALFSGLLWGIYEINPQWNWHVGGLGYTGMRGSQIYPVIGFDYSPNKNWTFLACFPIEYYVQYNLDPHWKFSLRARPLKQRFRVGEKEPQPRSIFSYSSTGVELNVKYQIFLRLEVEAYGGYNLGGNFYIKKGDGGSPLYMDVGGAPYGGINLNWGI